MTKYGIRRNQVKIMRTKPVLKAVKESVGIKGIENSKQSRKNEESYLTLSTEERVIVNVKLCRFGGVVLRLKVKDGHIKKEGRGYGTKDGSLDDGPLYVLFKSL